MPETTRSSRLTLATALVAALWVAAAVVSFRRVHVVVMWTTSVEALAVSASLHGLFFVAASLILLRLSGETLRDIGLTLRRLPATLLSGAGMGLGLFVLNIYVLQPGLSALMPADAFKGLDLGPLFADPGDLPLWLLLAVFKGGFTEELWRVTAITRFGRRLGSKGLLLAVPLSSAVFGLEHLYQGTQAVVVTGLLGLAFALVYLRRRRLLEAVAAHAVLDIASILMGYAVHSS